VSGLCPDKKVYSLCLGYVLIKKKVFIKTSARMTVQGRVLDISNNLKDQLKQKASEFSYHF
jgi:hypothetical protein